MERRGNVVREEVANPVAALQSPCCVRVRAEAVHENDVDPMSACGFVVRAERVSSIEARRASGRLLRSQSRRDPLR